MMMFMKCSYLVFCLFNIGNFVPVNGNDDPIETRFFQLTVNESSQFRATYIAEFQHLKDPRCSYDSETIVSVSCDAPATLAIIDRSDTRIDCMPTTDSNYTCTMNCTDTECEDLYVASNATTFFDDIYASITFTCEYHDPIYISGNFQYDGGEGSCLGSSVVDGSKTRTFHVGRLGVSCATGSSREYEYDDTYVECYTLEPPVNLGMDGKDIYTCMSGADCQEFGCNITFRAIQVYSYVRYFYDRCIEKPTNVELTAYPTVSPVVSPFLFSAKFEALWSVNYNSDEAVTMGCRIEQRGASISCRNDASILFLDSSDESVNCTTISDNEMTCISSDESIQNDFVRVDYACTGPKVPSSDVTFLKSESACTFVTSPFNITHSVAMGIICTAGTLHFDTTTECANASHQFYAGLKEEYNGLFDLAFLLCSESVNYELGSQTVQSIPNVTIRTDDFWLMAQHPDCIAAGEAPVPTFSPVSQTPTFKPQSSTPTSTPTSKPTSTPSIKPTVATTSLPISIREVPPRTESDEQIENQSNVERGSIIGIAVGCVAGIALIASLAYYSLSSKNITKNSPSPTKPFNDEMGHQSESDANFPTTLNSNVSTNETSRSYPTVSVQAIPSRATTSSPGEHVLNYKDQCNPIAHSNPRHRVVANDLDHYQQQFNGTNDVDNIPIAVAYGVSTPGSEASVSVKKAKEPPGRIMKDN